MVIIDDTKNLCGIVTYSNCNSYSIHCRMYIGRNMLIIKYIAIVVKLIFMEPYCRIRYKCSWEEKMERDIEECIVQMHVLEKLLEEVDSEFE